jgi:CheY-like chemotaxis protein
MSRCRVSVALKRPVSSGIRSGSTGGHTPIIAMTAHASKEYEEKCLAAGMDAYISKPINFQNCLKVIGDIIKRKPRG